MRKIVYIFLAHIVVLGSLWIYKLNRESEAPMVQEEYEQIFFSAYMKTASSGLEMLMCIDREGLGDISQGQTLSIAMKAHALDKDMVPEVYKKKAGYDCYRIFFSESDSKCSIYEQQ